MSALAQMQNGYLAATRSTGTPREIEYQLLSDVTGRLRKSSAPDGDFKDLAGALHDNLMIWQTLALDVAQDENGLPAQLRAQLFYLYEFALSHSPKVMRSEASADVLVDINMAVLGGLRQAQPAKGADRCQV